MECQRVILPVQSSKVGHGSRTTVSVVQARPKAQVPPEAVAEAAEAGVGVAAATEDVVVTNR